MTKIVSDVLKIRFLYLILLSYFYVTDASKKEKCSICRDVEKNFYEGLKKTAKSNFGGGNTNWEESRLGSYAFSETRLVEIVENLCSSASKECHTFVEEHEELVEKYWFSTYSKSKGSDKNFFTWLCIENIKVCCPENTYGPSCKACPGGTKRPCNNNGNCDGAGTREGAGTCSCNIGYHGTLCDACADGHFEELKNDTHTICKACHTSCKSTCWEDGPKGCDECGTGWVQDEEAGCKDVNECEAETSPCSEDQYCSNNQGSYYCANCHSACKGCTQYGANKCKECASGYNLEHDTCADIDECKADSKLCEGENQQCVNNHGSYSCDCVEGFIEKEGKCILKPKDPPKSSKKKSKQKSFMSNLSYYYKKCVSLLTKPSLLNYIVVLILFMVICNLFKGEFLPVVLLSILLMQYLFWFAKKTEKL